MRLGLTLPSFVREPKVPLEVARVADDAGLDGIFVYDHLFRTGADGTRRPALESVGLLGAVAAETSAIRVGSLVFRAWLRPAASLATAIETVARIAPERVVATIGAGDSESRQENETFGLGFGTVSDRVARLREAVVASCGHGARVWVGGRMAAVREVAVQHADGWNSWGSDVTSFASQASGVRAATSRPDFECTWGGLVVVDEDDAAAAEKARLLDAPPGTIVGGPETVAAELRRYGDAGASWVIAAPVDSRDPANARLLGERVRPLLSPPVP